jgi:hypothetical protein
MYGQFDAVLSAHRTVVFYLFRCPQPQEASCSAAAAACRQAQTQLPEEWQSRGYEDEDEEAVPWYVEFPEDRAPKKQRSSQQYSSKFFIH